MNNRFGRENESREIISVLLVDDIPETRENIKKLLAFEEQEFKVVGSVGTGREAIRVALETHPDIVIMDINMPDMDGIQATAEITKALPTAAVIMMSVQTDADYLRKAMQAGARNFLSKPVDPDELYGTIRAVYKSYEPIRRQQKAILELPVEQRKPSKSFEAEGEARAGHVIVVYSTSGGAGATTVATNLASSLMRRNIKVLLVDANLQFGDAGVFLKLQSQSTLLDLVEKVEDLDTEFFDSIVTKHESGLNVLLSPLKPEYAIDIEKRPRSVAQIIQKVAPSYDFIVVDTNRRLDDVLVSLTDIATRIVFVTTPTLGSVKNARLMLDLFDRMDYTPDKFMIVLNRVDENLMRNRLAIQPEAIERHLKHTIATKIPESPAPILGAVLRGVPVVANQRDRGKSPIKELMDLGDMIFNTLMNPAQVDDLLSDDKKKKTGIGLRLGRNS